MGRRRRSVDDATRAFRKGVGIDGDALLITGEMVDTDRTLWRRSAPIPSALERCACGGHCTIELHHRKVRRRMGC